MDAQPTGAQVKELKTCVRVRVRVRVWALTLMR